MKETFYIKDYCQIKDGAVRRNGEEIFKIASSGRPSSFKNADSSGGSEKFHEIEASEKPSPELASFLKRVYRSFGLDYPKFFKMDRLSKLAFMAAEILLGTPETSPENKFQENSSKGNPAAEKPSIEEPSRDYPAEKRPSHEKSAKRETSEDNASEEITSPENRDIAIVLSNRASSLDTDRKYQQSITDSHNFYPSPTVFVYTLPNICIGEISIRHTLRSENSFFIFDAFDAGFLKDYSESLLQGEKAGEVLCGWVDVDEHRYEAFVYIVSPTGSMEHSEEQLTKLYRTP